MNYDWNQMKTENINEWLTENEVTKCPPGEAAGADNLRFFSKRGSASVFVMGESKTPVSRTKEMEKRNARIKRKALKKTLAARKSAKQITNKSRRKRRRDKRWDEPRLSVLMGEAIGE